MLLQQVCPELTHEAVDYEESLPSEVEGALCMLLAIDTRTSQQHMDSIKQALLEVCPLIGSVQPQTSCLEWPVGAMR